MKSKLLKSMAWIAEHIEAVITVCILALGQLASHINLKRDVKNHHERLDKAEKDIDDHIGSPSLHRNPDFETNQKEIKAELLRINDKLDRALRLQPRRS